MRAEARMSALSLAILAVVVLTVAAVVLLLWPEGDEGVTVGEGARAADGAGEESPPPPVGESPAEPPAEKGTGTPS